MHPRTSPNRSTSSRSTGYRGAPRRYDNNRPARARVAAAPVGPDLEQMFVESAATLDENAPEPTWLSLGLPQKLVTALERREIRAPFAIQSRVLPDALAGRDVLGRAKTGSGKTLGFGLPMLTRLMPEEGRRMRKPHAPRGLVLVPTRELALQVSESLAPLGHALDVKLTVVVGGAPMGRQIDALERGTDIVVATPGRLVDLIERGHCTLERIEVTVLDEADYMADLGFLPAVSQLLDLTPAGGQRMLFSATLDEGVRKLVTDYLVDPVAHAVDAASAAVPTADHKVFVVRHDEKQRVLEIITRRPARTLLFVRTRLGADRLADDLKRAGVDADAIHGNLGQGARQRALDAFSSGRRRVLVATDVAARGIHVDDLDLVVHVDPPADHKDYMHRSGRTARAGASGTVLSLLLPSQVHPAQRLRDRAGVSADVTRVSAESPEVIALAESGEPVVVREEAPRRERPRYGRRPETGRRFGDRQQSRFGGEGRSRSTDRAEGRGPRTGSTEGRPARPIRQDRAARTEGYDDRRTARSA